MSHCAHSNRRISVVPSYISGYTAVSTRCSAEIIRMQNITDGSLGFGAKTEHEILRQKNLLLPEWVELYLHKLTLHSKFQGYTFSSTTVILNKIQTSQQTYSITITKISRIMLFVVITTNNTVWAQSTFMLKQVGAHNNHWRWLLCAPPGITPKILVLSTQCIYVFCVDLRTNSDLCHLQHKLIGFYNRDGVCLLRSTDWIFIYRQFNIQQFYVLPTQCIYVFCVDLRTNSDYFPIQH